MTPTLDESGDHVCEHGTAVDVRWLTEMAPELWTCERHAVVYSLRKRESCPACHAERVEAMAPWTVRRW